MSQARIQAIVLFTFLSVSVLACAQLEKLTGHYEGTITDPSKKQAPATIELTVKDGRASGAIRTVSGDVIIEDGSYRDRVLVLKISAQGESGTVTLNLVGDMAVGTYSVGGDKGQVQFKRTSDEPLSTNVKSSFATPIMFLGVYHMSNPGLDAVNLRADDVLEPARQRQMEDLVDRLARFNPTKIAIEEEYGDDTWQERYQQYVAGRYSLGPNEVEQIGFRLAKKLGLAEVYPVDFMMFMNGLTPSEMQQSKKSVASQPSTETPSVHLSKEDELLRQSTIVEYLAHINEPEMIRKGQEQYMAMLEPSSGDSAIYRNADLLANWYKRNLRIFSNVNRITNPGRDRILVIMGAGHMALLQEFASQSPTYTLVNVEDYLQH